MAAETLYMQDILSWIPENKTEYFLEVLNIENKSLVGIDIAEVIGMPVDREGANVTPILDSAEASVEGIIVGVTDGVTNDLALAVDAVSAGKYFVLTVGPAIINIDRVHDTDVDDNPIDIAALTTALKALGIKVRSEPAVSSTQTT